MIPRAVRNGGRFSTVFACVAALSLLRATKSTKSKTSRCNSDGNEADLTAISSTKSVIAKLLSGVFYNISASKPACDDSSFRKEKLVAILFPLEVLLWEVHR